MTAIKTRLERLESELSPAGRSIYEYTDAELLMAMGLPANATQEQRDARVAEIMARRGAHQGGTDGNP
jgi:hypothetical protein